MPGNEILLEKRDGIAIITLNRPERLNAISPGMGELLESLVESVGKDESVRVLVVTGAGKGFCSGADVGMWEKGADVQEMRGSQTRRTTVESSTGFILPFRKLGIPVIGAINGTAAGAGFALAMACDMRIASENARFGSLFIKRAITPASGISYILPRIIGTARACEVMFTGDWIVAQEAERLGIVNRVVPHEQLMPATLEFAARLAKGPPIALALTKKVIYEGLDSDLESHLDLETHFQRVCFTTEDFMESVRAFMEKREPVYRGK